MSPELLGTGLIFFQRLVLRAGLAGGPHNEDRCCERKNGSIENRFHRVSLPVQPCGCCIVFFERLCGGIRVRFERLKNPSTSPAGEKRAKPAVSRLSRQRDAICANFENKI